MTEPQGVTRPVTQSTTSVTTPVPSKGDKALPEEVNVWTADSLTDVFADSYLPDSARQYIQLDMAKNEYESAQIAIKPWEPLQNVRIEFEYKTADTPVLTARPIAYVYASHPTSDGECPGPQKYSRGTPPMEFPEYYENTDRIKEIEAGETRSFVIEAHTTKTTKPGTYSARAIIRSDSGTRRIPVSIRVYDVTLPEPADSSFAYSCWSDSNTHAQMINEWYGAALYSDDYWKVIGNFAKAQKKERLNCLWVPLTSLLQSDMTIADDGTYQFRFANFDKYIEVSLKNGSYKYLEGSQLMLKDWGGNFSAEKENGAGIVQIYEKTSSGIGLKEVLYSDPAAKKHLDQLLTQLAAHLKQKGWDKLWIQHGLDECFQIPVQITESIDLIRLIKEKMPFAKTVDAGSVYEVMEKYDYPSPRIDFYEGEKARYDAINASGDVDLWLYADTGARGDILFRGQEYPLISTRAIGWYCFLNNATGYLHWAWNLWDWTGQNPFADMANAGGPTDTYLVYPNMMNLDVLEGTRQTAVRDGFEDYELLLLAKAKNAKATQELLENLVVDQHRFERSSSNFASQRLSLLKLFV